MPRYVFREGGYPPRNQDFDQRTDFDDRLDESLTVVQGLLVHPPRERHLHSTHAGAAAEQELCQRRQSRITVTLVSPEQEFAYYPTKPGHPDVGIFFSRREIRTCGTQRTTPALRCLVKTALHERTTVNLSGLDPRLPNTHPDLPPQIRQMSTHRLVVLTNSDGGLRSTTLRANYRALLEDRQTKDSLKQRSAEELLSAQDSHSAPNSPGWSDTEPSPLLSATLLHLR